MYLVISYVDRSMMTAIDMKSYLFHSTCKVYYKIRYYNVGKWKSSELFSSEMIKSKICGIKLPEVHGIGKGLDPIVQARKVSYKANSRHENDKSLR